MAPGFPTVDGHPLLILRFDKAEEHARAIVTGKLRLTSLSAYRDLPSDDQGRLDRDEGLVASMDGSKVRVFIGDKPLPSPYPSDAELKSLIRVSVKFPLADTKILCVTVPDETCFERSGDNILKLRAGPALKALNQGS